MEYFLKFPASIIGLLALLVSVPPTGHAEPVSHAHSQVGALPLRHRTTAQVRYENLSIGGVVDLSPANAWAVGYDCVAGCTGVEEVDHMLILHWDGTAWSTVKPPRQSAGARYLLSAIAADSPSDAWAVGTKVAPTGQASPLILHWDGRAWSNASPVATGQLTAVTADSATDAWAVGEVSGRTLVLHWNGTAWTRVTSPDPGRSFNFLARVSAGSPTDGWATGSFAKTSASPGQALALHWNGKAWSNTVLPSLGKGGSALTAVMALSAQSAWAGGSSCPPSGCGPTPKTPVLMLRWNGSSWAKAATPELPSNNRVLGLAASSAGNVWAVGSYGRSPAPFVRTLIMHWNGKTWSTVTSPNAHLSSAFEAVSAHSSTDAWAVGTSCISACNLVGAAQVDAPLLAHWNGKTWSTG